MVLLSIPASAAGNDELLIERKYRMTAREATVDLERRRARAEGDAVLAYEQAGVEFRADVIDVDLEAKSVAAAGNVRLLQGDNRLFASAVDYDLNERTGSLQQAHGQVQGVYFAAESLRATPDQFVLTNGSFTTCDRSDPDYAVTAQEIIVRPNDRVFSRKAALWYKGRRVVRLPNWSFSIAEARPAAPLVPIGGYSSRDGVFAGAHYRLFSSASSGADLEARYTTSRGVRAYALGELRPAWGRVYATVGRRQDLTGADLGLFAPVTPTRDFALDRLPEIAIEPNAVPLGEWGSAGARIAAGQYVEFPTDVRASRAVADFHVEGRTRDIGGGVSMRPLVGVRRAWYDSGQDRSAVAYGINFELQPSENLALRARYLRRDGRGDGPFAFDAIEIARELGLGVAARIGPGWRAEVLARRDLDRGDFPALDVSIIRVAHCLEYGLTWRKVGRELGIRVGLAASGQVEATGW